MSESRPISKEAKAEIDEFITGLSNHLESEQVKQRTKLQLCLDDMGCDDIEELNKNCREEPELYSIDAIIIGVCMNSECTQIEDVETDAEGGWCRRCETYSVTSVWRLLALQMGMVRVPEKNAKD